MDIWPKFQQRIDAAVSKIFSALLVTTGGLDCCQRVHNLLGLEQDSFRSHSRPLRTLRTDMGMLAIGVPCLAPLVGPTTMDHPLQGHHLNGAFIFGGLL